MLNFLPWSRRKETQVNSFQNIKDRDKILEMLTKVKDQFSLSIYKDVYNISDKELAIKRKELVQNQNKKES